MCDPNAVIDDSGGIITENLVSFFDRFQHDREEQKAAIITTQNRQRRLEWEMSTLKEDLLKIAKGTALSLGKVEEQRSRLRAVEDSTTQGSLDFSADGVHSTRQDALKRALPPLSLSEITALCRDMLPRLAFVEESAGSLTSKVKNLEEIHELLHVAVDELHTSVSNGQAHCYSLINANCSCVANLPDHVTKLTAVYGESKPTKDLPRDLTSIAESELEREVSEERHHETAPTDAVVDLLQGRLVTLEAQLRSMAGESAPPEFVEQPRAPALEDEAVEERINHPRVDHLQRESPKKFVPSVSRKSDVSPCACCLDSCKIVRSPSAPPAPCPSARVTPKATGKWVAAEPLARRGGSPHVILKESSSLSKLGGNMEPLPLDSRRTGVRFGVDVNVKVKPGETLRPIGGHEQRYHFANSPRPPHERLVNPPPNVAHSPRLPHESLVNPLPNVFP